jgi:nitrous oxidase accessory protein
VNLPLHTAPVGIALALAALAGVGGGCSAPCRADRTELAAQVPARPEGCREVALGADLQAAVDAAADGEALCLAPGRYQGPLVVRRAVTVWGSPTAVIASNGTGTTVRIHGAGARLAGLTIDGSGGRYDQNDSAVTVTADDVMIDGVTVVRATYGLQVERAKRVRLIGNHVIGSRDPAVGLRGDSIRLWETDDAEVADNVVEDGRDLVVWYSRKAHVHRNRVERARYGTHFMYSHDARVEGNRYLDVTVGVFVMYSHGLALRGNVVANAAGAAGIAFGFKDAGAAVVEDNLLVHDEVGIYLDASPQRADERIVIRDNAFRLCRSAIVFHASSHQVTLHGNDFGGNETIARVDGGGDAMSDDWDGNYFDAYTGYDLDDDGTGDVPFELRSYTGQLVSRHPELGFFSGAPALALTEAAAHLDPLFKPQALLIDRNPRMAPVAGNAGAAARALED